MGAAQYADSSSFETFFSAVGNFLVMFCGSAGIGILFALISAFISLKIVTSSFAVLFDFCSEENYLFRAIP